MSASKSGECAVRRAEFYGGRAESAADEGGDSVRNAWLVFALLFALMVVDYIDRQIVVSMLPRLKAEWGLSDTQLGALVSIVSITVALGALPLSLLADRWSRVKSIFIMALIWSLATIACAFAGNFGQLLGARSVVGLGEAAYGTAGAALIASLFPARMRSTMLGAFLAAAVLGSVLGVMLGGIIAERWGWRAAFGVAGIPGLILAVLFWYVARNTEGARGLTRNSTIAARSILPQLLRPRTALFTCIGGGLQLAVVAAIYAWLPSYLNRYHDMPLGQAGVRTGWVILIGAVGAVLSSMVADRLAARLACARLYVPVAVAIMTTVLLCMTLIGTSPGELQLLFLAAGGFVMTGTIGPVAAVVIDVSHPGLRATATSLLALVQNLLGLAGGPLLTGMLADVYGLQFAMSTVPAVALLAAFMFLLAARTYVADVRIAEGRDRESSGIGVAPT